MGLFLRKDGGGKVYGDIIVRPVKLSEVREVYKIEVASFKDPYPLRLLETLAYLNPQGFLVAEFKGRVIGYVIGTLRWSSIGHIVSIAVDEGFRRKGVGMLLMREVMRRLRGRGAKAYRLEVRVSNLPAFKLYEKVGFRKVEVIEGYYGDGESAYVFMRGAEDL